jgi:hypothetical protein
MISTEHLDAYLEAMGRRDVEGTKAHMADDEHLRQRVGPRSTRDVLATIVL